MLADPPKGYLEGLKAGYFVQPVIESVVALSGPGDLEEAAAINARINQAVRYVPDRNRDVWKIAQDEGDCEDIALRKRKELVAKGWPAGALRLVLLKTSAGEDHVALALITYGASWILDNRTDRVFRQKELEEAGDVFLAREMPGVYKWEVLPGAPLNFTTLADVMKRPDWSRWPNFTKDEMRCKCGRCGRADMVPDFMDRLQALRDAYGKPMIVTSGFRCPEYNRSLGGGPEHPLGKAADISVAGKDARLLLELATKHFPRIGAKQHGPHAGRFYHFGSAMADEVDGFSPWIWTYD